MNIINIINEEIQKFNENFWKWFGNSKVVDGRGNPLKVFHGTTTDFSQFNGPMMYFAAKSTYANQFASNDYLQRQSNYNGPRPSIMPVYLRIENPLDITELGNEEIYVTNFADYLKRGKGINVTAMDFNWNDYAKPWSFLRHGRDLPNKIQAGGYDGVIMYEDTAKPSEMGYGRNIESKVFVVFNPEQIKSATGNIGKYDKYDKDITKENNNSQEDKINTIVNEEIFGLTEEYVDNKLYGYHCTPCKNLESIEKTGFKIGPRQMQGEGVYAFYNLEDDSSGNAAVGYGSRHVGYNEFCIVKFVINYPQWLIILNKKIAEEILGSKADIISQLSRQYDGWDDYYDNHVMPILRDEYKTPEYKIEYKNWLQQQFNRGEDGEKNLLFGNGFLEQMARFGIIYDGEYGIQFLIKKPQIMQAIGYHHVKNIEGRLVVGKFMPFTSGMDKVKHEILNNDEYEALRPNINDINNVEDLQRLKSKYMDAQMKVRNNHDYDYYQNLIKAIDKLMHLK